MISIARHFMCLALAAAYSPACATAQPARELNPDGWGIERQRTLIHDADLASDKF
jgi:hypothetical protein